MACSYVLQAKLACFAGCKLQVDPRALYSEPSTDNNGKGMCKVQ